MIAYKGLNVLANALKLIAERPDWRLTIAGAGPALTETMRARFNDERIALRPEFLSDDDLDLLIDAHDIVLAPYRDATQSGVVAQALARGKPVVATPVGALPEQLGAGRAGWIADAATAEAFGEVLVRVLDDSEGRAAKARGARALATEIWDGEAWHWLSNQAQL